MDYRGVPKGHLTRAPYDAVRYLNLGPQKEEPKQLEHIPIVLWIILGIALFIFIYLCYLYICNRVILYMASKANKNNLKESLIAVEI